MLLSPSQITLYAPEHGGCNRKWAFRYIAGIETPQHPAAALGTDVDDNQLQPYLRDGRAFDYTRESGYVAASGLEYLPPPQSPGIELQKHIELPSPSWRTSAFGFQGYVDLWLPDSGLVPGFAPGSPCIVDFKTTSDVTKWSKSREQLLADPQYVLYVLWALWKTSAKQIATRWLYLQTKGKKRAKATDMLVGYGQVAEQFTKINATAVEMCGVRGSATGQDPQTFPLTLPPNPEACFSYGKPCPYVDKCNLGPGDIVAGFAAKSLSLVQLTTKPKDPNMTMAMLAALAAKKTNVAGAAAVPTAPVPAPAAAPPTPVVTPPNGGLPAWATAATDPIRRVAPGEAMPDPRSVQKAADAAPMVGINPPESTLPPAPPVGTAEVPKAKRGRPTAAAQAAKAAAAPAAPPATPAPEEPTAPQVSAAAYAASSGALAVTATWAEEAIQIAPYQTCKIGPFSVDGIVLPGETPSAALARLHGELVTFAEAERTRKLVSALEVVNALGGKS